MTTRILAVVSGIWVVVYGCVYFGVIKSQHGDVAVGYLALLLVCVLSCFAAVVGLRPRALLTVALVMTGAATVIGLLSIGLLLVPAVITLTLGSLRVSNAGSGLAGPPYESKATR